MLYDEYRTHKILKGRTYISQVPQIQDFNFKDHCPDFVNNYASRNEFQGLNFCGMRVICKNSKIYSPRNLYEYSS